MKKLKDIGFYDVKNKGKKEYVALLPLLLIT